MRGTTARPVSESAPLGTGLRPAPLSSSGPRSRPLSTGAAPLGTGLRPAPLSSSGRRSRLVPATLLLLGVGLFAAPGAAQDPGSLDPAAANPAADSSPSAPFRYRFAATLGLSGLGGGGLHVFGSFEGGAMRRSYGVVTILQAGEGNGYTSHVVVAGLAAQLLRGNRIDLVAFAGPGNYGEIMPSGDRRSLWVPMGGLSARVSHPSLTLALNLMGWRGTYRGNGFLSPVSANGLRLGVGVGWGWDS